MLGSLVLGGLGKAVDIWSGREAAKDERSFNRMMYENRYQMTVKDLRKAGLNPALAYSHGPGSPASTSAADTGGDMSSQISSAVAARRLNAEIDLLKSQKNKTDAEAELTGKTMPPADPWRILYELFGKKGVDGIGSTAKRVMEYAADTVKTFPLRPRTKPYRQPLQPMTDAQRRQLQRTGSYTRPARR